MVAVYEATVQVLLREGLGRFTTTRVAERAGVSVGSLYQYFPNKNALLAAVLERHLDFVVTRFEQACAEAHGRPLEDMAAALVGSFVAAKTERLDISRALYLPSSEVGGPELVAAMTRRAQSAAIAMLATASDADFEDLTMVTFVLLTSVIGSVQALLQSQTPSATVEDLRSHLVVMALAYLRQMGHAGAPRRR